MADVAPTSMSFNDSPGQMSWVSDVCKNNWIIKCVSVCLNACKDFFISSSTFLELCVDLWPANNQNGRWNGYKCWRHKTLPMDIMRRRHRRCCCSVVSSRATKGASCSRRWRKERKKEAWSNNRKQKKRKEKSCAKSIKYINLPRNVHGKRIKKLCRPASWMARPSQWKI